MSERVLFGGKSPKALPWQPLPHMDEWLEEKRTEEVSDDYIRMAKVGLSHFSTFAAQEGIRHPDEISRHHLLRFQAYLTTLRKENGDPLALSYRQQLMKYLRNWVNWLAEVEHIETNPWVRVRVGTTAKKPKPLEEEEIALLFATHRKQAFTLTPFHYHRREVILVLLYGWGLRLNELASLSVSAMDMRLDYVTVRNKSRKGAKNSEKTLPYADELKAVVGRYLRIRAQHAVIGDDALVIDSNGKQLSTHMMRHIISELGKRAGVTINPHRLRDTFGTTMLDNDVDVEKIMKMMGHTTREQTMAYSRVNDHKVAEAHGAVMNPLLHRLLGGSDLP